MKRILAPILLLTLVFPALVFGETMDDLVKRDGLHYKKFSDVPFTGKVTGEEQGSFRNGKKDGPFSIFFRSTKFSSADSIRLRFLQGFMTADGRRKAAVDPDVNHHLIQLRHLAAVV